MMKDVTFTSNESLEYKKISRSENIKGFLYGMLAFSLTPLIVVGAVIYAVLSVLELLFRTINLGFKYVVLWIDQNITPNIR